MSNLDDSAAPVVIEYTEMSPILLKEQEALPELSDISRHQRCLLATAHEVLKIFYSDQIMNIKLTVPLKEHYFQETIFMNI